MDGVGGKWVRCFLDLTCDFWAKNEKNNFRVRVKAMKSVALSFGLRSGLRQNGPTTPFSLQTKIGFPGRVPKEAAAIVYKAADDLHGSGFFVVDQVDVALVEGEDLCAGVKESGGMTFVVERV
jgi:hypothetical protein